MRHALTAGAIVLAVAAAAAGVPRMAAEASATSPAATAATAKPAAINWGKPWFTDNFNATKVNPKWWWVYNSPTASTPRTVQSVQEKQGTLRLIAHTQKPYGYVGGGLSFNDPQTYGRWVYRFRVDAGAGSGPGFLMWPKGAWPQDGEVDIIGNLPKNRTGGDIYLIMGSVSNHLDFRLPKSVNFTKWHTMAFDWLPDHMTFWLDGKALWTVKKASGFIPTTPFRLAIQLDAGCDGACHIDKTTPANVVMYVDSVQIYKKPASYAG
ncbi:MAG TPA: glycoside hydrolase family 16 protein [Trebonia sp.]|nr:glycoside hydrolase family 16 protein [Trebonia sp.]